MAVRVAGLAATCAGLWALPALGQIESGIEAALRGVEPRVERPRSAGRVVRAFDFEESQTNPGLVPQNWFRAQDDPNGARSRPGFPAWNRSEVVYDAARAFAGDGAVMLPTEGGSTSMVLGSGVIPIFEGADYMVTAKVRTTGLTHARAAVTARFLDRAGRLIPASQRRSELVFTADAWTDASVELVGAFPDAAYVQIELLLLQPDQQGDAEPTEFRVWPQDFKGEAWFDDVTVLQLPRIELSTKSVGNMALEDEPPQLSMMVRDLAGEELKLDIAVLDTTGRVVDRLERRIPAGSYTSVWKPNLAKLGWYRARMLIRNESGFIVGGAATDLVWVAGGRGGTTRDADRSAFGLVIDELPGFAYELVPEVVRRSGAGWVTLPAWSADTTAENAAEHAKRTSHLVGALLDDWRDVTLSFPFVPTAIVPTRAAAGDPWPILTGKDETWLPLASPVLEQCGQRVNRWQIGGVHADWTLMRPGFTSELAALRATLSRMVPGPIAVVPARPEQNWDTALSAGGTHLAIAAGIDDSMSAEALGIVAGEWAAGQRTNAGSPSITAVARPLDPEVYGLDAGGPELVRKVAEFWASAGGVPRMSVALGDPWRVTQGRRPQLAPTPELAAFRTAARHLAERRVVGTMPVAPGVVCYILSSVQNPGGPGALVAWSARAGENAVLEADLGEGRIEVVDVYGNRTPAPIVRDAAASRQSVRVPLSERPVFIEGVDVNLARFLASFALDQPFLDSSATTHDRELLITNPWPTEITGTITILEPGGFKSGQPDRSWRISPRASRFTVGAGQVGRVPITLAFAPTEEAGPKPFVARLELSAGKSYGTIEVTQTIEVGLKSMRLDVTRLLSDKGELSIEAIVHNMGASSRTLQVTAFVPGMPRSKSPVINLISGGRATRRFNFAVPADSLAGQRIVVSVDDPSTGERLTRSIIVR